MILPAPWLNLKRVKKKQMVNNNYYYVIEWHTFTYCWLADGTQVQAHSPIDSATISGTIGKEGTDGEEPRDDEAGNYINLIDLLMYDAHTCTYTHNYMHHAHTIICTLLDIMHTQFSCSTDKEV